MSVPFAAEENLFSESGADRNTAKLTIDTSVRHGTFEGFGASGAWWSQDVGGWTETDEKGVPVREAVMELLYGHDSGIGIHIYRYNLGAGVGESGDCGGHFWRNAQSFINEDGSRDYSRDENALWCLKRAVELGVKDVVFFSNSAPSNMTVNGRACGDRAEKKTSNLAPERYGDFADYVLDAAEHFLSEGVPIKEVSPVNEPQWKWQGGQEGCHFEPHETAALYKVFYEKMEKRGLLDKITLAVFESGQWGGEEFRKWFSAIMEDETLRKYIKTVQGHSYNSTEGEKEETARWLGENYPNIKRSCTEWTEMRNLGRDTGMESALDMANMICTDFTALDAVSWSYWIAVSCYNWRDGLIYVDTDTHKYTVTKRLYGYGNFTKFIEPESVRVEASAEGKDIKAVAFEKDGRVTAVAVNSSDAFQNTQLIAGDLEISEIYLTDSDRDLERVSAEAYFNSERLLLPPKSIMTIILKK